MNAFKGIPLYQIFQQEGATGGGPYRFARDVSRYYSDEESHLYFPDPVGEAYIKKHAGNAGLTSSEMSSIIVESGHKSAIQRTGDYRYMGREVHGLEKGMFGDKYKQKDFAGHFMGELKSNTHLQNVLMKISMERARPLPLPKERRSPRTSGSAKRRLPTKKCTFDRPRRKANRQMSPPCRAA